MRREYQGAAFASVLTQNLGASAGDLTIYCDDLTNWPTGSVGPFYVVVDRGLGTEEKILCSSRTGNVLTVFDDGVTTGRAADDTSLAAHNTNAVIEHVFTATDADEANLHVNTASTHITVCTSATRPASPVANQTILQTDTDTLWSYIGGSWVEVSGTGATGGGSDKVFWENDTTITTNYTITTGKNAGTFSPVTINNGVTVTVPSGSTWVVV